MPRISARALIKFLNFHGALIRGGRLKIKKKLLAIDIADTIEKKCPHYHKLIESEENETET